MRIETLFNHELWFSQTGLRSLDVPFNSAIFVMMSQVGSRGLGFSKLRSW